MSNFDIADDMIESLIEKMQPPFGEQKGLIKRPNLKTEWSKPRMSELVHLADIATSSFHAYFILNNLLNFDRKTKVSSEIRKIHKILLEKGLIKQSTMDAYEHEESLAYDLI